MLFGTADSTSRREHAATFLKGQRTALRTKVAALTGQYRYVVDQALDAMIQRCRELDLRVSRQTAEARLGAAVLSTMVTLALSRGHKPRFRR
jgi:hypothetical protein